MNTHLNDQILIDMQPMPRPGNDATLPLGGLTRTVLFLLLILGAIVLNIGAAVLTGIVFGLL